MQCDASNGISQLAGSRENNHLTAVYIKNVNIGLMKSFAVRQDCRIVGVEIDPYIFLFSSFQLF